MENNYKDVNLFLDFIHFFNAITLHYLQKLPTLPTMLIVDVKSGRFMYQSGRVGDKAKKRKSPAKRGRVGISAIIQELFHLHVFMGFLGPVYMVWVPETTFPLLAKLTFHLFLCKIQPTIYMTILNLSQGHGRQLWWESCLASACTVTLAGGTNFLHINSELKTSY